MRSQSVFFAVVGRSPVIFFAAGIVFCIGVLCINPLPAQTLSVGQGSTQPAADAPAETISLNFPDNIELKSLIEYVSDRLGINILYDEQVVNQRITIKTPAEIPKSSLLGLLQSALKMKGFILVDGDQPGWKRVVPALNLIQSAQSTTRASTTQQAGQQAGDSSTVVTQVFSLKFGDPTKAESIIKPFLTLPGGNSLTLADQHLMIVTDFATNLRRIAQLIQLVDQPQARTEVRFVQLRFIEASQASSQIAQLLAARTKQQGNAAVTASANAVEVTADPRTNRLALIGTVEMLDQAEALIRQIDVPIEVETKFYTLKSASPERVDQLSRAMVEPMDHGKVYHSVIDKESNVLIVTGTPQMQQCVAQVAANVDVAIPAARSPIRFYKLMNTTAADVLETVQAIAGEGNANAGRQSSGSSASSLSTPSSPLSSMSPAAVGQSSSINQPGGTQGLGTGTAGGSSTPPGIGQIGQTGQNPSSASSAKSQARTTIKTRDAIVTADPNTNTIIVVAAPSVQAFYEQMIQSLDKRRPQVLVECTIVTLDTTNDLSFGVELGGDGKSGNANLVTFSSFGLSTPNPATGGLTLIPGTGFNAALLKPDVGTIIIQALATSGRSEVFSAPKILVNDNATGTLSSIAEAPYTSVNASQTVSTTSFGGYASAGTSITLTPHISEGDHLNLEYTVQLNSFTGDGSQGIPPPRQTDSVTSEVTIPDGDIIVVGGLNRKNFSLTQSGIPLLRQIPILKYLFSNNSKTDETTTLFVFIRPIILRDDQFRDLKYYSVRDAQTAKLDPALPQSEPLLLE